jgi:hypothetical protein
MLPMTKKKPAAAANDTGAVMALMAESPAEEEAEKSAEPAGDPLAAVAKVEAALAELKLAIGR